MSSASPLASARKPPADSSNEPLIPESYIDAPSQRLYILSIGLLCQAVKIFDWLHSLISETTTDLTLKWIFVDLIYCLVLKRLRIPRLNYASTAVILQVLTLCLCDGILFGTIHVGVSSYSLSSSARNFYQKELSTSGRMINIRDLFSGDDHLKGEHTVRMSPISTAKINPGKQSFCLSPHSNAVFIPVLLNNTTPKGMLYSLTHLGTDKVDNVEVGWKELRTIDQHLQESLQITKTAKSVDEENNEIDWDGDDEDASLGRENSVGYTSATQKLEKTQSIYHLKITKPGIVRLERITDKYTSHLTRIFPGEVAVGLCPQAEFAPDSLVKGTAIRCIGSKEELSIKMSGVPPMSLNWHRSINGRKEYFSIERIEGEPDKQGQTNELRVPLDMILDVPGTHEYVLDSLTDGFGNHHYLSPSALPKKGDLIDLPPSKSMSRSVTVLSRAAVSFRDCAPGKPASLLIGSEAPLSILARESDPQDGPWEIKLQYQPQPSDVGKKGSSKPWVKSLTTLSGKTQLTLPANAPGEYSIIGVKGQYCPGDVLSPETCRVVQQPFPTAEIEWKRIHECSGDTGVSAYLVLHGRPPFQVFYQQKRNDEKFKEMSRTFQGSRGEIILQPPESGTYTYKFTSLSDANYKRIDLEGPVIQQKVHPLASASFGNHGGKLINSCSGSIVDVDVDLRGDGPWSLELQIVSPMGSETVKVNDLKKNRERIQVPIPRTIDEEGGTFQVDLVSVQDAYNCTKNLAVPGLSVNVRRVKPSVRFYSGNGKRETTILQNQDALLPLRLTGEAPWKITYKRTDPEGPVLTKVLSSPNDVLRVRDQGTYKLLEVIDSQCPGSIVEPESTYKVDWTDRPNVRLSADTKVTFQSHNGSFIRAPVCEGKEDFVDLEVSGRPPYQVVYNVARNGENGGTRILDQPVISSVQSKTRIQLLTSQAGRNYYEVKQVGDANYPLAKNKAHAIPRQDRLLFEQEVIGRPSAYFKKSARLSHCLRDTFTPITPYSQDDLIILDGRPPFHLELSVKSLATSETYRETVELWESHWKINLPTYEFSSIGPHLVTIESVRDASSCGQSAIDPLKKSIWVDVAESAAIVPFDRREHFCVGDVTQFQLEGIPPWTINYKANNRQHEQIARQSPFALVQQYPGTFLITSVSHQQQQCRTTVDNIQFEVHALPSAQVAEGREIFEDIHEGSQAQIVFTLNGVPPFTFTYQRSEPPKIKGAKPGKVLETHTVSGVMSKEYSIYSALEGTWTVTFISDKYCRYPPAQPDTLADKIKS